MSREVVKLLNETEQELRRLNAWMSLLPSMEAMASTTPFCMDTMAFSQWLQWVFVPRVRAIHDQGEPLPTGSYMKPYVEEALWEEKLESIKLVELVGRV